MEKTTYFVPHFDIETAPKFTQFCTFTDLNDLLHYVAKVEKRHNAYITRLVDNDGYMTVEMASLLDDMIMYVNDDLDCCYMARLNFQFMQTRSGEFGRWETKTTRTDFVEVNEPWED